MANTWICNQMQCDITALPTTFITDYLPYADGDCIKVYLYLLHAISTTSFSLKGMEQALHLDRSRSCYALHYWEKNGLLSLTMDETGKKLLSLCMLPVKPSGPMTLIAEEDDEATEEHRNTVVSQDTPATIAAASKISIPSLDSNDLLRVKNTLAFQGLLVPLQQLHMFNEVFKEEDADLVARVFLKVGQDEDIVIYLSEYCLEHYAPGFAGKRKKSLRKLETLADAVVEHFSTKGALEEISDDKKRKDRLKKIQAFVEGEYALRYATDVNYSKDDVAFSKEVLDLLCPGVANATTPQLNFIHFWRSQFDEQSDEMIKYACQVARPRMMAELDSGKKSMDYFAFLNGILKNWKAEGCYTVADAIKQQKKRSAEYVKNEKAANASNASQIKKTSAPKKDYNDFPQHDYDYSKVADDVFNKIFQEG